MGQKSKQAPLEHGEQHSWESYRRARKDFVHPAGPDESRIQPAQAFAEEISPTAYRPGQVKYPRLDRSRNEVRLLKVLPPQQHSSDTLDFSSDVIRCQLEYENLDLIDAANRAAYLKDISADRMLNYHFAGLDTSDSSQHNQAISALKQGLRYEVLQDSDASISLPCNPDEDKCLSSFSIMLHERRSLGSLQDLRLTLLHKMLISGSKPGYGILSVDTIHMPECTRTTISPCSMLERCTDRGRYRRGLATSP